MNNTEINKSPEAAPKLGVVAGSRPSADAEEIRIMRRVVSAVSDIKMAEKNLGFCEYAGGMDVLQKELTAAYEEYELWNTSV
jgi:hypothetical protein